MQRIDQIQWPGWNVVRLIGRGSFGAVYEIQRDVFGETERAALKVITIPENGADIDDLRIEGYDDESITSRFHSYLEDIVKEYSTMAKMKGHPNVVYCDDVKYVQHDDGIGWDIYFKMELLTPIVKCLDSVESENAVIDLGIAMCNALALCKEYNIVHRDIKPQNIFVSQDGTFKLGDFGIAKTAERTTSGTKVGTYKYMAPEVYNNRPYGPTADQYSLGLVMYWLLNDRRTPFSPKKATAIEEDVARKRRFDGEQIPPPAHGSKQLQAIVLKACAYDPKQRYASASEMLEALRELKKESGPTVPPSFQSESSTSETVSPESVGAGTAAIVVSEDLTSRTVGRRRSTPIEEQTVGKNHSAQTPHATTQGNDVQYNQQKGSASVEPHAEAKQGKKKSGITVWIAVAAVLVAVFGGIILLTRGKSNDTNTNWVDELPDYVTEENYTIEERTLYSSRKLETTSSTTSNKMAGWELYETAEGNGEFGAWSDWSASKVIGNENREVETQTRYHYRDKETTSSSNPTMSGWELYDTTYTWGDYGNWSEWSESSTSKSDSRDVETKIQYRYREKSYTTSSNSSLSGWTQYDSSTSYGSWGNWSGWSNSYIESSDLRQVETRYVEPTYRTEYNYSRYNEYNYASTGRRGWNGPTKGYWGGHYCQYYEERGWSTDRLSCDRIDSGYGVYGGNWYNEQSRQVEVTSGYTQYRYRDRSITTTYHYYQWSNWSNYSDSYISSNSDREVSTRTLYRYRDRFSTPTYHFWRWGNWSAWSTTAVSQSNTKEVETTTFYRYRDRVTQPTYYFQRWTEWSEYFESPVEESDTVEVRTKTQYRYHSK